MLIALPGYSSPIGHYRGKHKYGREELNLRRDSTFQYRFTFEDFEARASGRWSRTGDSVYLNSWRKAPRTFMRVEEIPDARRDSLRFYIYDTAGKPLNYAEVIFRRKKYHFGMERGYYPVPYRGVDSFRIRWEPGVYYYPWYRVKNKNTTVFKVWLFTNNGEGEWFFDKKAYLLKGNMLCPAKEAFCMEKGSAKRGWWKRMWGKK